METSIRLTPATLHMLRVVKAKTDSKSYDIVIRDLLLNIIKYGGQEHGHYRN